MSTPGVDSPPTGKIPGIPNTPTENTVNRIIPNQNSGIEYRTRVVVVATLSKRSPRFHALRTPSHTPKTVASTVAVPTSNRVGPIRGTMTSQTGTLNCCEGSSGTNGFLMYWTNCSAIGALNLACICLLISGSTSRPRV